MAAAASGAPPCAAFVSPHAGSRAMFWYLLLPSLAFLVFLALRLEASVRKLRRSRSHVMAVYYAFVWAITALNVLRALVALVPATGLWDVLWLVTRFGQLVVEVSVIVFLVQGLATTTHQALLRTLAVSGAVAGLEAAVKVIYIFALHVPLFLDGSTPSDPTGDTRWSKWGFWLARAGLSAAAYAAVAALPATPWRDLLPSKPELRRYAAALAAAYACKAAGALLIGARAGGGYCLFAAGAWLYDAGYPPLVYVTFLAGFLQEEELDTDLLLYSEMREADFV
ncbi:MAG: transmembrane protein adipocyte-associated 1 [Monoraphidium minutum]|nr:MAG: transmembrane protein adipocyte-associated 1 [Monoraphidium minutum]